MTFSPAMPSAAHRRNRAAPAVWLAVLWSATLLLGGSAREDAWSLLLLRPVTAALFAYAVLRSGPIAWRRARAETLFACGLILLPLVQLIPLPPPLWQMLSGDSVARQSWQAAAIQAPWHGLSLTPRHSWNAVFALLGPIAGFLLALELSPRQARRGALLILLGGALSALLGALQILGVARIYLYEITNHDAAVGLFANRNHAAVLLACLLPLLALQLRGGAPSRTLHLQRGAALAGALLLIPLVLLTGSRSGLICVMAALGAALWVHGKLRLRIAVPTMAVLAALVSGLFFLADRAPALQRLTGVAEQADLRVRAAPVIWNGVVQYWPWGSGIGSFAEVYQVEEPQTLLGPAYLNHAHNDVLELLLTGGLPAAVMISLGIALLIHRGVNVFRPATSFGEMGARANARAGLAVVALLLFASLVDYPLRTPILATVLAFAIALSIPNPQQQRRSWSRSSD